MIPEDTTRDAFLKQMEIFNVMSSDKKLLIIFNHNKFMREMIKEGIRLRHPDYTDEQILLALARVILSDELFLKVYSKFEYIEI